MDALKAAAWALAEHALPTRFHPDSSCFAFAAAAQAALRGTGARFVAGGAFLPDSQMIGWGLTLNPAGRSYYVTADQAVDPLDGGYCGHCWVELGTVEPRVVDLMGGYVGPTHNTDWSAPVIYRGVTSLGRSVRAHYAEQISAVARVVRKDREFCAQVAALVEGGSR